MTAVIRKRKDVLSMECGGTLLALVKVGADQPKPREDPCRVQLHLRLRISDLRSRHQQRRLQLARLPRSYAVGLAPPG